MVTPGNHGCGSCLRNLLLDWLLLKGQRAVKVQRASVMCVGEVLTDPDILVFKSFCNPKQETMQSVM